MIKTRQSLVGAIVIIGALFSTAVSAVAETCTLTLKRRETAPAVFNPTSYMYWTVRPQYIYMQMQAQGTGPWQPANTGGPSQLEAFKRIVTKEPKYQSEYPFRGVVKLGSQEYAFALDVVPPKAKQPDVKQAAKNTTEAAAAAHGEKAGAKSKEPAAKPAPLKAFSVQPALFRFQSQRRPDRR